MSLNLTPQFIEKTHRSCIKPVSYFPKYRRKKEEYIQLFDRYKERYESSLNITISYEELVNKIKEKRKKELLGYKESRSFRGISNKTSGKRN